MVECRFLDTEVDSLNPGFGMLCPCAKTLFASVDSAVKLVPGGNNLVKGVQCYELIGGIALNNQAFCFLDSFDVRGFTVVKSYLFFLLKLLYAFYLHTKALHKQP